MSASLAFTPLSPALGVVIENYDPCLQATAEQAEALRSLLWQYSLLLFPQVQMDAEQQRKVMEIFGPVTDEFGTGQYYSIERSHRSSESDEGTELPYHSDFGFTKRPLEAISLYGLDVPPISACTGFANGVRGCQKLPSALRARLEGKLVLHASDVTSEHRQSMGRMDPEDLSTKQHTSTLCPAIFPHPKTGAEILFLNDYMSIRFEGLDRQESDMLLSEALSHLHQPENVYEHIWRPGDLIIFDNIALSHKRGSGLARTLRRIVVGESPFLSVLPAATEGRAALPQNRLGNLDAAHIGPA